MTTRRFLLCTLAIGLLAFAMAASEAAAQGKRDGRGGAATGPTPVDGYECPACHKMIDAPDGTPPTTCPFCGVKLEAKKNADGTYNLTYTETSDNKLRKPLLYGGGGLLVVGLIALLLKYTVFAPAKPKKKKKRRDDDEDDDDDRPRKKRRPVVEDEEEEQPRKVKKKPRIVDED